MSRFLLSPAPRQRLAAAGRLRRRILMPAFAGVAAASGTAVKDGPAVTIPAAAGQVAGGTAPPDSARPDNARPDSAAPAARQPRADRPAVPDTAHPDDIKGAFGTLRAGAHDEPASWAGGCAACSRSWVPA